jgi:hypothetical protein
MLHRLSLQHGLMLTPPRLQHQRVRLLLGHVCALQRCLALGLLCADGIAQRRYKLFAALLSQLRDYSHGCSLAPPRPLCVAPELAIAPLI